ncbi:MAG TPA: hypothetical protein VK524_30030, partial [Polyangiaceae bacterium]|nr:hypothetical protein [Polyangiaceae bacterium]
FSSRVLGSRERRAILCSLTLLAAPAASECGQTPNTSPLPCDIDNILREKCQACHGSTPKFGAPMPLTTYADLLKPSSVSGETVWQRMNGRVNHATSPMPPIGQTPLTDAQKARLNEYFGQRAPAGTTTCTNLVPPGDLNALSGPEYLPCTPNVQLTAHAAGSTAKYNVPTSFSNTYSCFTFRNPFPSGQHSLAFAPIIDNDRIVHHWILYGMSSGSDGAVVTGGSCYTATVNGTMVAGWAPGGANAVMANDVSLNLNYPFYTLQVHHSNMTGSAQTDASGVAFCSGSPRQNVAGIITLGTSSITIPAGATNVSATGTCGNISADGSDITVISTSPHMHLRGNAFRTEHWGYDDLSNIPRWDFDVQRSYPLFPRRVVKRNETLRTTCWYNNPTTRAIGYGPATTDEMCYDFITAYPYDKAIHKCGPAI